LAGCGGGDKEKSASQVLARVNGDEISVSQLNLVLAQQPVAKGASTEELQKQILDRLINRELAVQEAEKQKLDRTPQVVLAIEEAKRDLLARAYAEKVASGQTPVTDAEATKYYNDNPDLFAQRKIYQMKELGLPSNAPQVAEFKERVDKGEPLESIAAWLKGQGAVFSANAGVKPAEQLPMAMLPKLASLQNGQHLVVNMPQAVMAVEVVNSQLRPVDQAAALPQIKLFLSKKRAAEAVEANLKHLRESAKIDYVGQVKPVEPAPAAEKPQGANQSEADSINKGVAGLK
jgi:EpsD family peptidyl-prolyl cis-trans isomerase